MIGMIGMIVCMAVPVIVPVIVAVIVAVIILMTVIIGAIIAQINHFHPRRRGRCFVFYHRLWACQHRIRIGAFGHGRSVCIGVNCLNTALACLGRRGRAPVTPASARTAIIAATTFAPALARTIVTPLFTPFLAGARTAIFFIFLGPCKSALFFDQRFAVGQRDLIIIGVNFGKGQKPVPIAAVIHKSRLKRGFNPRHFSQIDVSCNLAFVYCFKIEFFNTISVHHNNPCLLGMGGVDKHFL